MCRKTLRNLSLFVVNHTVGDSEQQELLQHIKNLQSKTELEKSKQEYCYRKCMNRDVVVQGNPRVYKQLKVNLEMVLSELKRIENGAEINAELLETIRLINTTLYGLKGECE